MDNFKTRTAARWAAGLMLTVVGNSVLAQEPVKVEAQDATKAKAVQTPPPAPAPGSLTIQAAPAGSVPTAVPGAGQFRTIPGGGNFGGGGFGQGSFGSGGFGRGAQGSGRNGFTMPKGGTVSIDFRGTDIGTVLKFFSDATGWQILPDPGLAGNITIISPKQLTIEQAWQVLQSTLEIRGYTGMFEKKGEVTILKIIPFDQVVKAGGGNLRLDPGSKISPEELRYQVVTKVIPIENVDARALAQELVGMVSKGASIVGSAGTNALIITDTATNVARIEQLISVLDKAASNNDIRIFYIKHSDANDVANTINNLFRQVLGRGAGAGGFGGQPGMGGQFGQPGGVQFNIGQPQGGIPGQPGQPGQGGGVTRVSVTAVADTRTNSVFVVASKDNLDKVADVIKRLDDPMSTALLTRIVKIKHADAVDIADTVNMVLSGKSVTGNNGGGGGGGASFAQRLGLFGGGGFGGGGFGGGGQNGNRGNVQSSDPFGKVVANARTNSVIITATDERMMSIEGLIADLDVDVPTETTTFVMPLKYAQAQDISYILGQAFGSTTGGNQNQFGGGFNIFGQGNQRNNNNRTSNSSNRRLGSSTSGGSGFGRSIQPGRGGPNVQDQGDDPQQEVRGTLTPNGFIPDTDTPSSRAAQFGFGGGGFGQQFGGGGRQQTSLPAFGRGQTGNFVGLLQLMRNVTVTFDPNSNNLIINTTPDNMRAIKEIVDALDVMPRQVMIEVIIAEATLDATMKLGFQFDASGVGKILGSAITQGGSSAFPLGTGGTTSNNISSPLTQGGQYGIQAASGAFRALVQALGTDNKVKILSTPKVFTSNNQAAEINISQRIPYLTSNSSGGLSLTTTQTVEFADVGVILDVTPRITKDRVVTIDVTAEASELLSFDILSSTSTNGQITNTTAPRIASRTTNTSVSVRDNEAVVLGGLMRENKSVNVSKIPLLGDIPILGHLFRFRNESSTKTELMIFLIPHVVETVDENRKIMENQGASIMRVYPELMKDKPQLNILQQDKDKANGGKVEEPKKKGKEKPAPKKADPEKPLEDPGKP